MTIWRMRIECWIPKAIDTHSECVKLITFPLQQWQHERSSVLSYIRISGLVNCLFKLSGLVNCLFKLHFSRWWSGNGNHLNQRTL